MSNPSVGLRDMGARPTLAFQDAVGLDFQRAPCRLIRWVSSETLGSPALLPSLLRNRSISKAVLLLSL